MKQSIKRNISVLVLGLFLLLLLTGTFAWQSFSQRAFNPAWEDGNYGGRIRDEYDGVGSGNHNKDVFAENFGTRNIFTRVRLREFLSINGVSVIDGMEIDDVETWAIYISELDNPFTPQTDLPIDTIHSEYGISWELGHPESGKYFMPTFNHAIYLATNIDPSVPDLFASVNAFRMSEATGRGVDAIASGTLELNAQDVNRDDLEIRYDEFDETQMTSAEDFWYYGVQTGPGDGTRTWAYDVGTYESYLIYTYLDSLSGIVELRNAGLVVHEAQPTLEVNLLFNIPGDFNDINERDERIEEVLGEGTTIYNFRGLMTVYQWNQLGNPEGNFWILDTDGWFYWNGWLIPGEGSTLLLNEIYLPQRNVRWDHVIEVESDFFTCDSVDMVDVSLDMISLFDGLCDIEAVNPNENYIIRPVASPRSWAQFGETDIEIAQFELRHYEHGEFVGLVNNPQFTASIVETDTLSTVEIGSPLVLNIDHNEPNEELTIEISSPLAADTFTTTVYVFENSYRIVLNEQTPISLYPGEEIELEVTLYRYYISGGFISGFGVVVVDAEFEFELIGANDSEIDYDETSVTITIGADETLGELELEITAINGVSTNGEATRTVPIVVLGEEDEPSEPDDPIEFTFTKVDDEGEPLAGATFNLYAYIEETGSWQTTPIAAVTSEATGLVELEFTGNRYKLVETTAPTGFITPLGYWIITIIGDGDITVETSDANQPNLEKTKFFPNGGNGLTVPAGFEIPNENHEIFADPESGVLWRVLVANDGDGNALIITEEAQSAGAFPFVSQHAFQITGFNPTGYYYISLRQHMQRWANRGLWSHEQIGMVGPTLRSLALDFEFQDNEGNTTDRYNSWAAGVEIPMLFGAGAGTITGNQNHWICTRENANTTCPYRRAISRPTGEPGATFEIDFDSTVVPLFSLSRTEAATYFFHDGESLMVPGNWSWWTRSTSPTAPVQHIQRWTLYASSGAFTGSNRYFGARMRPAMWIRLPEVPEYRWTLTNEPASSLTINQNDINAAQKSYISTLKSR